MIKEIKGVLKENYKTNNSDSENLLIENYLPLVYNRVNALVKTKYKKMVQSRAITEEDLISAGVRGLLKSATEFNPDKGTNFESYALQGIDWKIKDWLKEIDKVPLSVRRDYKKLQKTKEEFLNNYNSPPTTQELSNLCKISPKRITTIESLIEFKSIPNEKLNKRKGLDSLHSEPSINVDIKLTIKEILDNFPRKERLAIYLIYGMDFSQEETGKVLGYSQGETSKINRRILKKIGKLRKTFHKNHI